VTLSRLLKAGDIQGEIREEWSSDCAKEVGGWENIEPVDLMVKMTEQAIEMRLRRRAEGKFYPVGFEKKS